MIRVAAGASGFLIFAGAYVNDLGQDDEHRIRIAYGPNYERLARLKRKYDPDNFFRLNPNIKPD